MRQHQATALTMDSLIHRDPEIVHSAIDGEVVMMSIDQGEYFGLDAIGSRIWNLLEKPTRLGELCRLLADTFDVDAERCRREVAGFLGDIEKCGLIRIAP
jgi:coenzyme PQQ synthesis protein D (PqqD)